MVLSDDDFKNYFQNVWWPNATDDDMEGLMQLYTQDSSQGSPYSQTESIVTDVLNVIDNSTRNYKRLASLVGDFSLEAQRRNLLSHWNHSSPAWNYIQDVDVPLSGLLPDLDLTNLPILRSFHAFDVWFNVFRTIPSAISKNTQNRQAIIISFIRDLDPNYHGLDIPDWPEYTTGGLEAYRFVKSGPEVIKDDYRVEGMEYINSHPDAFLV